MVTQSEIEPVEVLVGYRLAADDYSKDRWGVPLRVAEQQNKAVHVFHEHEVHRLRGRSGLKVVWLYGSGDVSPDAKETIRSVVLMSEALKRKPDVVPEMGPDL